ncbi:MAG: SUMF1/EgtB/PvdO family nonheme iron enzyme, partial [Pseudomonadota bacterium]
MFSNRVAISALLGAVFVVGACTTDFTGYHLESGDAGASGADVGAAGSTMDEPDPGTSRGAVAGDAAVGGVSAAGADAGGASVILTSGGTSGAVATSGTGGSGGTPIVLLTGTPPSCEGLANSCGPDGSSNCCSASLVLGGVYDRSNQTAAPATVSDFALDLYEVSVGRFRNFVQAYTLNMTVAGAGKNPNGGVDSGWNTDWNPRLPTTAGALVNAVTSASCGATFTYTAEPGAHESLPMTCLTWYEAFAFCAWDGGRLPTEAEWNYVAAAGNEERPYPWGNASVDISRAVFQPTSLQRVGSKGQPGSSNWGQMDMAGNAWEWNLDVYAP